MPDPADPQFFDGGGETAHLISIGGGWGAWRWFILRSAGFALEDTSRLSAGDETLASFEELARAEAAIEAARRAALEAATLAAEGSDDRLLRTVARQLRSGQSSQLRPPTLEAVLGALADAEAKRDRARDQATARFTDETTRIGQALREAVNAPRFREALTWQNPHVLHTGIDALLRRPAGAADSKSRQYEMTAASYLQRYCLKNDSIGFFGPITWGRLSDGPSATVVRHGQTQLRRRTVYFEYWCIDALAQALAARPELRRWAAPRRLPTMWLDGETLHYPIDRTAELPAELAVVLAASDGQRTADAIARALVAEGSAATVDEVFERIEQLVEEQLALWTFEVPTAGAWPERSLRTLLGRAPEEPRRAALDALDALDARRNDVARAAGDPAALDRALGAVADEFTRLTGASGSRSEGQTYAGRTLLYEDCQGDVDVELGRALLDRLAPPLRLILQSARWFTFTVAGRFLSLFAAAHDRIARETGSPRVDLQRLWRSTAEHFSTNDKPSPIVAEVVAELQRRWATLLLDGAAGSRVERSVVELQAAVEAHFAAPHPGWPGARYHSPDVMIAARDEAAIERGELQLVLGEVHTGMNTAVAQLFVKEHPHPEELLADVIKDRGPAVTPLEAKERAGRADHYPLAPVGLDIEVGKARSWREREAVVGSGELVVEASAGTFWISTRDGRRRFGLIEFLEHHLIAETSARFSILPRAPHSPRVTVGELVVARETWRFSPAEVSFASLGSPIDRFRAAQDWTRKCGLPRYGFYRIPEEPKPCFVDFKSPLYVDVFSRHVRKASSLTLSEMLPAPEQSWLTNHRGQHVTSELRIVCVDPVRYPDAK